MLKMLQLLTNKGTLCTVSPNTACSPIIAKTFLSISERSSWLLGPPPVPTASRLLLASLVLLLCFKSAQYYENQKKVLGKKEVNNLNKKLQ